MALVYLSLGSNVGDRKSFVRRAISAVGDFSKIMKVSSLYETEPWGKTDQPNFLNLCLLIETSLSPEKLLSTLKDIENNLGRTRTLKWAEREIDIDILFYDSLVSDDPSLVLPHPHIEERAFVLIPLSEIAPDFIHPVSQKPIAKLAKNIGDKTVRKLPQIMGILNVTPDSFSDGGELEDAALIRRRVRAMIDSGVDIIDIGGESTRPGHQKVDVAEEIKRVVPTIKIVRSISKGILISIDTQKSEVAAKALEAGADIINDVSAFGDKKMPAVIKEFGCEVVLMRNRPLDPEDIVGSCRRQFEQILETCRDSGIDQDKITLDPGLGFGDLASGDFSSLPGGDPSANTELVLSIKDYSHGMPVLIGVSRKRFLGTMSGQSDAKKRLSESLSFAALAKYSGASVIRVHDVAETIRALQEN